MPRVTVVIEYIGPKTSDLSGNSQSDFSTGTFLPNGKKLSFEWNAQNGYKVEVPTVVTYADDFNVNHEFHKNFALFLLEAYGPESKQKILRFVEKKVYDEFETDALAKFETPKEPEPAETPTGEPATAPSRKGKKDAKQKDTSEERDS